MPVPKKNQVVGLDIGSHSIKVVEIDDSKRGMELKNFGIFMVFLTNIPKIIAIIMVLTGLCSEGIIFMISIFK